MMRAFHTAWTIRAPDASDIVQVRFARSDVIAPRHHGDTFIALGSLRCRQQPE